ncbi:alanine--tRNA ligase-related protein [Haloarcula sp. S1AR25-5A]|uniref:Alanine--tRNA ligase-related protein n=1 Tax=Haloarcula terrestris TaxID=2950533 RepID=A0AAE4EY97_9EURY|nr:DHHA1 domain-containing protein [Haloarcula terrestris]MDS0222405.1 alanine--tRNA ligase-related protein [Haloarcula terrestris]
MGEAKPVNLAAAEPYVRSFESQVRTVDGRTITLDETYFYAEGGGQPADTGTLAGVDVVDVQKQEGVTVHTLAAEPDLEAGDTVQGEIDDSARTYSMRAHTASHVIYGAGRKLFDDHAYGGFDIGEDTIRLDFETTASGDVNPLTVQRMANETVWNDLDVDWYEMDVAAASERDDIVFNLGDDANPTDTVRIVEIGDWDIAACGGTHVRTTSEVGPIKVLDVSNPGANLVRVEYAVGPSAIQRQIDETRNATRAADTLDTSVDSLSRRAEQLLEEKQALQSELDELGEQLLDARLAALAEDTHYRDGTEWLVGTVDAVGPNTVADRLGDREELGADIVVLAGQDGATFVVVGTDGETDANTVIDDVTDEFGGGGGGRPTLAQGGGLDAEPEAVVEYLRDA